MKVKDLFCIIHTIEKSNGIPYNILTDSTCEIAPPNRKCRWIKRKRERNKVDYQGKFQTLAINTRGPDIKMIYRPHESENAHRWFS